MKKITSSLVTIFALTQLTYAGGDIAPVVEPFTEPDTDSGSAMGIVSMLVFMFLTTSVGSFFMSSPVWRPWALLVL